MCRNINNILHCWIRIMIDMFIVVELIWTWTTNLCDTILSSLFFQCFFFSNWTWRTNSRVKEIVTIILNSTRTTNWCVIQLNTNKHNLCHNVVIVISFNIILIWTWTKYVSKYCRYYFELNTDTHTHTCMLQCHHRHFFSILFWIEHVNKVMCLYIITINLNWTWTNKFGVEIICCMLHFRWCRYYYFTSHEQHSTTNKYLFVFLSK